MIYLLEDDESIRELVCYSLEKGGNETLGFDTPSGFFAALEDQTPSLVLLDVMLPEEDGFSVLKKLRQSKQTADIPVIMLTAKDSEFDKVTALDAGADDYITKPFGIMELGARVNAVLRRYSKIEEKGGDETYIAGDVTVSVPKHEVKVLGEVCDLTLKEFMLLCFLLRHRGTVASRDKILREVWGYDFDGENRTVDVHVRSLRQKLGESGEIIETVRGVGYKISDN